MHCLNVGFLQVCCADTACKAGVNVPVFPGWHHGRVRDEALSVTHVLWVWTVRGAASAPQNTTRTRRSRTGLLAHV